jgi:hypothetical protein
METHLWWSNLTMLIFVAMGFMDKPALLLRNIVILLLSLLPKLAVICAGLGQLQLKKIARWSALARVKRHGTLNYRASTNRQESHLNSRNQSLVISNMA